jgi:uncharacterized protein
MTHPNVQLHRDAYEAFGRGDVEGALADLAEDVVWHIGGRSPIAGDRHGRPEILEFLGQLMQASQGTFRLEVKDICGGDEYVYALVESGGTIAGRDQTDIACHVHRMRDGRTVESWFFLGDQYTSDEAMTEALAAGTTV